jgi:pectin methylesterase-like acyl-CoA thioesterase
MFIIGGILLSLMVVSSLAGEVSAATIRVPKDYASIQKAVDAARKGDTVRVSKGTYYENITMKEGVTLEGGWNHLGWIHNYQCNAH